jgi:hypothetical protein
MAVPKLKYYKNLTKGPVRIQEFSLPKGGALQIDAALVNDPKFSRSVGVLIGEITKREYDEIQDADRLQSNVIGRRDLPTVITIVEDRNADKGYREVVQTVETDLHSVEVARLREQQREMIQGVRPEMDVSAFPGAEFGTRSRPDKG